MIGVITSRDVLLNLRLIWAEFGFICVARCLFACASRQKTTFLEVAFRHRRQLKEKSS
jgi:hypothetical protein